jgi:type IV pilus assembly protein PilW
MKIREKRQILRLGTAGFSLIELMVAIAIVGIILIALSATFQRSGTLYTTQNVSAALQEEVRAAVEIMAREIRMAGYDPFKTGDFEIKTANTTHLMFTLDLNDDGVLNTSGFPNCEKLSFRFSNASESLQIICGESTGSQDVQTLIGGVNTNTRVTELDFEYMDNQNNSTSFIEDIRGVVITLTAQAPAGRRGMIERSYSTWVEFRNAAPNAAYN